MTVRINFLPRNYQPPKQLGARELGWAAAAAVAVVATGVYYMSVYTGTVGLEEQIAADQARHETVKAQLAQATFIKGREEQVARAEAEVRQLAGRHWSGVLLTLRDLTPEHVTWTSLKVEGNNMVLQATSRGLVDVAQLFGGLTDLSEVEQVSLKYVNEQGHPMAATVKPGEQVLPEAIRTLSAYRQLEFEMVITLKPAEGRAQPHGT